MGDEQVRGWAVAQPDSLAPGLIAPCGMNCGLCIAHRRRRKPCPGCNDTDGASKPGHCVVCAIKTCEHLPKGSGALCVTCPSYPCARLRRLDKRYRSKYRMSMIENLEELRRIGAEAFIESERGRWACPNCGALVCVHRDTCLVCGESVLPLVPSDGEVRLRYPEVGVCGLSCRLCPHFHTSGPSRCTGCKGESRMAAGCPFITCAVKRKGIEFCWECEEHPSCPRWDKHRAAGRERDSFVTYAGLEENVAFIGRNGIEAFVAEQREREDLLLQMLAQFNEGRSKTYYSIAVTLLSIDQLQSALDEARLETAGETEVKVKSKALHARLDAAARARSLTLALRK